ncbi:MAG: hypothetical protein NXI24_24745 [bacterium]|nr:hypothetical protein [bacterium]
MFLVLLLVILPPTIVSLFLFVAAVSEHVESKAPRKPTLTKALLGNAAIFVFIICAILTGLFSWLYNVLGFAASIVAALPAIGQFVFSRHMKKHGVSEAAWSEIERNKKSVEDYSKKQPEITKVIVKREKNIIRYLRALVFAGIGLAIFLMLIINGADQDSTPGNESILFFTVLFALSACISTWLMSAPESIEVSQSAFTYTRFLRSPVAVPFEGVLYIRTFRPGIEICAKVSGDYSIHRILDGGIDDSDWNRIVASLKETGLVL